MPERRRILGRRALLAGAALVPLLAACGRKGDLELPEKDKEARDGKTAGPGAAGGSAAGAP